MQYNIVNFSSYEVDDIKWQVDHSSSVERGVRAVGKNLLKSFFFKWVSLTPTQIKTSTNHFFDEILSHFDINKLGLSWTKLSCQLKLAKPNHTKPYQTIPNHTCLLYTSPSPRDGLLSRMPSSA